MILKLFEAQLLRLAAAVARKRGAAMHSEAASLANVAATVESSVSQLFEAAGLSPEVAEIAAKAYAAGWNDGIHRGHGVTLADAVIGREYPFHADPIEFAPSRLLN